MHKFEVIVGTKILHAGKVSEVTAWLAPDKLQVLNISTKEYEVITPDEIGVILDEHFLQLSKVTETQDLTAYSETQIAEAQSRYDTFSKYIDCTAPQKIPIDLIASELGLSKSTAYRLLARFQSGASLTPLICEKRGRKYGTKLIAKNIESIIGEAIISLEGPSSTISNIAKLVRRMCASAGLKPPSDKTITSRLRQQSSKEQSARHFGPKKTAQDHQVRGGKHITSQPLDMVQIDHCIMDIIVVDSEHRKPICRPWLTVAIDVHTRAVLGFYLSLSHPSALSNAACIVHAVMPKNIWLQNLNLQNIQYPMYGVPRRIHVDNGKDFRSAAFVSGCAEYDIKLTWRPPGAPHYGGHIERYIGTLMRTLRGLPGATLSNVADRKRYSNINEPGMTFAELRDWVVEQVGIYHLEKHSSLGCSPIYKWEHGFQTKNGQLKAPVLIRDYKKLFIDFLPFERGSIQRSGVRINCIDYYSPAFKLYSIKTKCIIKYNPASLARIWVKLEGVPGYIECSYADVRYPDISLAEFKAAKKQLESSSGLRCPASAIFAAYERNERRVLEAIAKTKKMRIMSEKRQTSPFVIKQIERNKEFHNIDYSQAANIYDAE